MHQHVVVKDQAYQGCCKEKRGAYDQAIYEEEQRRSAFNGPQN